MLNIYVGYDSREPEAYQTCEYSLRKYASTDLDIRPLKHLELRKQGVFDRPWRVRGNGQMVDERDGQPFSTEFSFTRFLVPHLAKRRGIQDWVLFIDCDFLFLDDVAKLFAFTDDDKHVMVVKHRYAPALGMKMDGQEQHPYHRKLWSSLMLFNCRQDYDWILQPRLVNWQSGSFLHGFHWIDDDRRIGDLPESWNHIPGHSPGTPKAVHFTEGGPWHPGYENVPYAELWREHYEQAPRYGMV